ncbi:MULTISPECIES: hypothetical protein [unclassified Mesorhizobium]|uniref:hypothetical protein n=1 Tax=unclassified Mesorhizobium TaxID=325217 RepID=UPI00112E56E9|nr:MULTISPECIES: hypothetical protein [unclassified Mesorhizobium]TPK42279.1 hypothetical protein FJ550_30045 [Mesorhizobium sp. B2-5-2]TPL44526.1 hypothetical protein FJ961_04095 [Mesorhizobium sp. B2-4-5]TPM68713.1 hypothetical protein FJ968_29900 [Mesorhizobium sp. B2-1-6]TPN71727.1 hypothetical protein FJ985_30550 [Mesorhizobium sp. B1-1-2]
MSGLAIFLYAAGSLLAVQYSHEIGGGRLSVGTLALALFWPVMVPLVWGWGVIQTVVDAVRS